jgi:3-isopropylmalate/(R)-2-methylmalate dehydratase small subunit
MALEQIKLVSGSGLFVAGDDIDTDQIIPARFLLCVTFDALGGQLFYDARFEQDGSPKQHALNDLRFTGAKILLSGKNFGCGSSREHAPQSIHKAGFRAVIAESFAEIFFGNSTTLGIPCVSLRRAEIAEIASAIDKDPKTEITVDVEKLEVRVSSGKTYTCEIKPSAKDALVRGEWDPIAQLLEGLPQVDAVKQRLPYTSW